MGHICFYTSTDSQRSYEIYKALCMASAELSTGHFSWTRQGETLTRPDPRLPTKSLTQPDPRPDPSSMNIVFNWIIIY